MKIVQNVPGPSQDSFNSLSDQIANMQSGAFSAMPSLSGDGIKSFSLSANTTVSSKTIPAGTRIIGVMVTSIFHGIGIANGSNAYLLRYAGGEWSVLGTIVST